MTKLVMKMMIMTMMIMMMVIMMIMMMTKVMTEMMVMMMTMQKTTMMPIALQERPKESRHYSDINQVLPNLDDDKDVKYHDHHDDNERILFVLVEFCKGTLSLPNAEFNPG